MDGTPIGRLGLERVCWVRVVRHAAGLRAEVAGIVSRRPVVRAIPVSVAAALVAEGVPTVITGDHAAARDPLDAVSA